MYTFKRIDDHWCDIIEPRSSSRFDPWCQINTDPNRDMTNISDSFLSKEQMTSIENDVIGDIAEYGYPSANGIIEQLERMDEMTQENFDYFADENNYGELMNKVGFTAKTFKYMGVKSDIVDTMWRQMRQVAGRLVSNPASISDNGMWFQVGRSTKKWLYKGIMHYIPGQDMYAIKLIRVDMDWMSETVGDTTEIDDGWIDGIDAESAGEYIMSRYTKRNKQNWVEYTGEDY